jgi:hypothetical protein
LAREKYLPHPNVPFRFEIMIGAHKIINSCQGWSDGMWDSFLMRDANRFISRQQKEI